MLGNQGLILSRDKSSSLSNNVQTSSWLHLASCVVDTNAYFPEMCDTGHSSASSAEF
jgi:hypothetical protein